MALTVLMNAGPWLPVPPGGYGGIETVIATLVPGLRARGVRVVLCGVEGSTLAVDRFVPTVPEPRFPHITGPYNAMMGIAHAHMGEVLRVLREEPVDLVHDHVEVVGAAVLGAAGAAVPPVLQTLHWDLRKHPDFYARFDGGGRVWFNGVSEDQLSRAPERLRAQALAAIPLAAPLDELPFRPEKGDAFLCLGRFTEVKAQDLAAEICRERGWQLDMAGPVAGHPDREALEAALGGPDAALPDVRFYLDRVRPLEGDGVRWIGSVTGARKAELIGRARALLTPIRWSEPGATTVVEALACGTPVVGMRRGALGMLVDHGVTGFLADDEAELPGLLERVGEIDPAACRAAAEERFSADAMAARYLDLYGEVLRRSARPG